MWLHSVACLATRSTRASTGSPACSSPLLEHDAEGLVIAEAEDVLDPRAAVPLLALDRADVGDLASARGVEGGLGELHQVAPRAFAIAVPVAVTLLATRRTAVTVVCCSSVS